MTYLISYIFEATDGRQGYNSVYALEDERLNTMEKMKEWVDQCCKQYSYKTITILNIVNLDSL